MPVAFNPPPFPTADTTLVAQVDPNADASVPPDAFSQLLLAAGGDALSMAGTDPRDALVKGRLVDSSNLRGLMEASLRLAADGKSAAALLGVRDADEPLEATVVATTDDAQVRVEGDVPIDAAAIMAALNAAVALSPRAEVPVEAKDPQAASSEARDGEDPTAECAMPDNALAALPATGAEVAMPGIAAHRDATNIPAAAPATTRTEKAASVEGAPRAATARAIVPAVISAPASDVSSAVSSDVSSAVATAKELLGDSVAKFKEALEATGSAVSAQAAATPQPAATQTPVSVQTIDTPVGAPGFEDELAGKLAHVVMLRNDRAEFHLHPAELGPVDVQISFASDQAVVLITAPQAATRDALEQTLPYLRDMLADQGISLGQATVQGERNPAEQDEQRRENGAPTQAGAKRIATDVEVRPARIRGLVDVFA